MNSRIKKKQQKRPINRAAYTAYPPGTPGGGMMYVPAGQQQGTLGQTFYGSYANIPIGTEPLFSPGMPLPTLPNVNPQGWPTQFKFPVAYNTFPVDRTMGNPDIPSFQQLRTLAKLYNGITLCERTWFDMVPKMKINIVLKPEYITAGAEPKDYQTEITYFMNWFESPDKMHDLHSWLRIALREQTQIDELYIYKRRKRNGKLHALEIHAGDQFKPLLDDWGKIPQYPQYGYQQYPWGLPGAWFTTKDLVHYQESPAADTPYGQSRVERIIMLVNQALRKQKKDLAHFTEGNIPQGMMLVPESAIWTPDQIDAFEQAWNSLLAGNATQQVRMRFTQPGMKYQPFEQYALDPTFDKFLINIAVSAYGLSMQDVAFTEDIHKSSGDFQENVTYRRTVDPLATIYAQLLTSILNNDFDPDLKGEMFQVTFGGYEEEEDVSEMSGAYSDLVKAGILGVTAAGKLLKLPDDPDAPYIGRVIVTKDGPVFLDDMATDKMRQAQVQAQLAGLQAATVNPQSQPNQKQQNPMQTSQTAQDTSSTAPMGTQPKVQKPNSMQQANSAPQLNPKNQQSPKSALNQTNKTAAVDIGGMAPQLRAVQEVPNEEKPEKLSKEDEEIENPYHDFQSTEDDDEENNDDFDPSLMGDTLVDTGPDDFDLEQDQQIEDLGGEDMLFDPSIDEDKMDWSPEDYDTENEVELLLNSDKDEPFSELERVELGELERHHPGGHDHDQKLHGNWAHAQGSSTSNQNSAQATATAKSLSGASKGPSAGQYGPINKKIMTASAAVQTAAKDLLTARQNLVNANAANKMSARAAVKTARQELHDARLALELYRQQARQMRIKAQQQARADAAKRRAELKQQQAQQKAERQKAKAKLAAQKQKSHLAKSAAAAKAKAAKLAAKAQLKAQIAAAKAAKKTATSAHKSAFKTAAKNNASAKTVQNLTNTIASKAVLYNTLAARPISKNWTQQDAADAHQISQDLKQLADLVNNHADETQMTGLLNQMNFMMSDMSKSRMSHKISSNAGRPGAASGIKMTSGGMSGRNSVLEKLMAKAQSEASLNRAVESVEFYEDSDEQEYSYTIGEIIELFTEQMQDEETEEEIREDFERSEKSELAERTVGQSSELSKLKQRGIVATTWRSDCSCDICQLNNGLTRKLGEEYPSGHMLPPCHPDCPCEAELHEGDTKRMLSSEYKNWRQRALEDIKAQRIIREFTPERIPLKMHHYIQAALETCTTQEEVKQIFIRAKEIEEHQLTVFLDVDGVLSITNAGNPKRLIEEKDAWPIPLCSYLLQSIDTDPLFNPVWMTHWGQKANGFTELAGIEAWPVAFPLSKAAETEAESLFPTLARKMLAVSYYMRQHDVKTAIWVQDGFAPETKEWAIQNHITLIDTNAEPYHSILLGQEESRVQVFLSTLAETLYERI